MSASPSKTNGYTATPEDKRKAATMEQHDLNTVIGNINTSMTTATTTTAPPTANGHLPKHTNMRLHFSHVCYTNKKNDTKPVQILNDTCGVFKAGRLTAILGPSGAGKTSMLNVISGFKANGVTGEFLLNDQPRELQNFRKLSSYIPQDFDMLDLLTVQETIRNSADFKLPTCTSHVEKQKIIDDILQLLNMEECRNTLVHNISGGERKRLSIAIELVTNPPLMFFDEPTSGLDSVASLQVLRYLQRLAHDGRIIVCVVHQPSSRLIQLFDDVLVMCRGEVLYCGTQEQMLPRFERSGFVCPQYYNPADFVLDVSSEPHTPELQSLIQQNKAVHWAEGSVSSPPAGEQITVDEKTHMLPKYEAAAATHASIEMSALSATQTQTVPSHSHASLRPKTQVSVWRQFVVLLCRSLRAMSRNLICVQMRVIMHIVVAVLIGIVFWDIGNEGSKVLSNMSCVFFMLLFIFFANAMPSILLCPQETAVFVREYLNGWYSISAYYLAKITSELPMLFICPTFFVSIVYFMTGQPHDVARFAMSWGIGLLTGILGHLMGLVFGATFQEQMAIFLLPTCTIPLLIFSGFFIRIHELIPPFRPLCDLSFFRYSMEGLMQAIYSYERAELQCNAEFCYFKSPQKFLKEMDMLGDRYGGDVLSLTLWILVLLVAFFLSLLYRIKRAQ